MRVDRQKLRSHCDSPLCRSNSFARNEGPSSKTEEKLRFYYVPEQLFRTKWAVDRQKLKKNCDFTCAGATLSHEMRVDRQKLRKKLRFYLCRSNPFARNEGRSSKIEEKIAILLVPEQPVRTKWGSIVKNCGKNCDFTCAGATLSHEMRADRQKLKKNCDFTCAGATLSHEMRVDHQKLR